MTMRAFKHTTRSLAILWFFMLMMGLLGSMILNRPAHAQGADPVTGAELSGAQAESACHAAPFSPPCVGAAIKDTASVLKDRVITPTFGIALLQGLLNIGQFVTNRLAFEAAMYVANGGIGQDSLFYETSLLGGIGRLSTQAAGEAVAELSDALNSSLSTRFDLCLPPGSPFTLSLAIGIKQKYQPRPPRCDILEVANRWGDFVAETWSTATSPEKAQTAILSKLAESAAPGRNELSAAIKLNIEVTKEANEKQRLGELEQSSQDTKDVVDSVTGKVKTPHKAVEDSFFTTLKDSVTGEQTKLSAADVLAGDSSLWAGLGLTAASTFTNTLLSQLFDKIYTGLFTPTPDTDPFNIEALADSGQSEETLSNLFATTPFATTEYNALTEFVVCPPQGFANRGLNNCVMDSNFLAVVSRGNTGVPLTIQEAIDEELLNGDWPFISPNDFSKNSDPLCYTYGFCYSNLVKLRKARVLPIGWELAALRNDISKPKSLSQIINEFNNCNQYGTVDGEHPFCHLIDPNWVLKYPDTQCRATVNGEIRLTQLSPGRQSVCADSPSCLSEDGKGQCVGGYGYCVREKNIWRFRGDECPVPYAGCLALKSTTTGTQSAFLINTVDFSVCGQDNAGCQWYRTNKFLNTKGTVDVKDDTFDWLLPGETYKDRIYFTRNVQSCAEGAAGCSELIAAKEATLNLVRNPSFEDDADKNNLPDKWFLDSIGEGSVQLESVKPAARGSKSLSLTAANGNLVQIFSMAESQAYTLSYFLIKDDGPQTSGRTRMAFYSELGAPLSLEGLSLSSGCDALGPDQTILETSPDASANWKRVSCSFVVPKNTRTAKLFVGAKQNIRYDGIQLEPSEIVTDFATGFSADNKQTQYTKIAPDYLKCTGAATDSPACASYAQMCQAQDVGCALYTPEDGDPAVPAITSSLDACPSECVGYDTFKQEKTKYDDEDFPLHFIPSKATACTAQHVGCDSFTNLSFAEAGGEAVEHYTDLRACLTSAMANGENNKESATFFTWEGSDNAGYQLRSWTLLESNEFDDVVVTFDDSGLVEQHGGQAPCTKWEVSDKDELICVENGVYLDAIELNKTCDQHTDIFTNPDCREFFDAAGFVHYREFSKTVTVNDACQPYRKDQSTQDDCDASGGYWDATVGFCRYFGLSSESTQCPAAASGCRSYTGGAGRNSATLLFETFESGSYKGFEKFPNEQADLLISNESIATDGHSLRASANQIEGGFATFHVFLNNQNADAKYNPTDNATKKTTCTDFPGRSLTPAGCAIDIGGDGTPECVVGPGEHSCGELVNKLVPGKSYVVQFLAKGSGNLKVGFDGFAGAGLDQDLVNLDNDLKHYSGFTALPLSGSWQTYTLGPFDSGTLKPAGGLPGFTKDAILYFVTDAGQNFYIDNLVLKQVEENITVVKDSWVVPSTCDSAPNGVASPQYYLGCEAYSDHQGKDHTLYQFSKLCSEKVVSCEKLYRTFESASVYEQAFNLRCMKGDAQGNVNNPQSVGTSATPCTVKGKTYCTIPAGQSFCTFDYDGTFDKPPLDLITKFGVVYGPETVVVPSDRPTYLVNDGSANCDAPAAGCTEVGKPKYSQDQKTVVSFESVYFVKDPDQFEKILCDNNALFCDEFSSTKDGNFYFKNPLSKTCEYKASVEINKKKFSGWFKSGTSEPCYPGYVVGGDQAEIWKNGDAGKYDGWVGVCPQEQDLCSEFIDIVDTEGGLKKDGTSYFFKDNNKLADAAGAKSGACNGQISQKAGCALFNNRSRSELTHSASASYIVSTHADALVDKAQNALVDPVSCSSSESALFTVNSGQLQTLSINPADDVDQQTAGVQLDLCKRRCHYASSETDPILSSMATLDVLADDDGVGFYERSCLIDTDCPVLKTVNGKELSGSCAQIPGAPGQGYEVLWLQNDSNTVLKVNRDRSCAAWLACNSSRTSWNEQTNKYEPICDSIDLCVDGRRVGQDAQCAKWDPRDPEILTAYQYSKRDVSWNGQELSGFAIPNQLPVELYDQFNLNPPKACADGLGNVIPVTLPSGAKAPQACEKSQECAGVGGTCQNVKADHRLVYNAGPCDSSAIAVGGVCQIGRCEESGTACSLNKHCPGSEKCITGACQAVAKSGCANADCSCSTDANCASAKTGLNLTGSNANVCDPLSRVCVDKLTTENVATCGPEKACGDGASCIASTTTAIGACFNDRCLTNIRDADNNGFADPVRLVEAIDQSCRGYPEVDSPYPNKIVEQWQTPKSAVLGVNGKWKTAGKTEGHLVDTQLMNILSEPFRFVTGYEGSNVCGMDKEGRAIDCACRYDKVSYADGASTLYQRANTSTEDVPPGLCQGGPYEGTPCNKDSECSTAEDQGSCLKLSGQDTLIGWGGYCIEKDTSIQLYASTKEADQACLTWLPVDQLSGATDLYAKYTSAGFPPQDAYVCAEITTAFDIGTSSVACAETIFGYCDEEIPPDNDLPELSAACPKGWFAIMAPCLKGVCEETWPADDDYPYFCVPKGSRKTDGDQGGQIGDICLPPSEVGSLAAPAATLSGFGDSVYLYSDIGNFNNLKTYYDDCRLRGVTTHVQNVLEDQYNKSYNHPKDFPSTAGSDESGSRDLSLAWEAYPVCESLVQVGQQKLNQAHPNELNVAWTNRVWQQSSYVLDQGENEQFAYRPKTPLMPFGLARHLDELQDLSDPYPHRVVMCEMENIFGEKKLPIQGESADLCEEGFVRSYDRIGLQAGQDARAFYQVGMGAAVEGPQPADPQFCKIHLGDAPGVVDCTCVNDGDCNWNSATNQAAYCQLEKTCQGGLKDGEVCGGNPDKDDLKECGKTSVACNSNNVCFQQGLGACVDSRCAYSCVGNGQCIGGPKDGAVCGKDTDCRPQYCPEPGAVCKAAKPLVTPSGLKITETADKAVSRLQQFFAKMFDWHKFDDGHSVKLQNDDPQDVKGSWSLSNNVPLNWTWDVRKKGDGNEKPTPPQVYALENCAGSTCRVGREGAFSVNDQSEGEVLGDVSKRITVSFYTAANSNQMPIRQMIVDWGDDFSGLGSSLMPWPTGSQSGSDAPDNFYKNHLGLDNFGKELCELGDEFGHTSEACASNYVAFSHDYVCSKSLLKDLEKRTCQTAPDGRLLNSPCTGGEFGDVCVYQPRVHVKDNWGWCTGFCNAGDDGTNGCFGGEGDENNECQIDRCPSDGIDKSKNFDSDCPDAFDNDSTVNPWVNFDGYVIIEPES